MLRGSFPVLCLLLILGALLDIRTVRADGPPTPATQDDPESKAREAFNRGRIHYDNGNFQRSAEAFEEAYRLSNRHPLLYNLYLAYRDANQQDNAARALASYLALVDAVENRTQLEARLKALEDGIAKREAEEAADREQAVAEPAPAPPVQKDASEQKRWWLMPVAVMASGGALMAGSLATGLMALGKQNKLETSCSGNVCDPSQKATADSGQTLALVTDVLLFSGIAAAATGTVLLFLKKPKATSEAAPPRASANFVCTPRTCGAHVGIRF